MADKTGEYILATFAPMNLKLFVDIIGWIGSLEVVLAYLLISSHHLNSRSAWYQLLNLTGALFLIANTVYYGAYPSTFINIVWVVIAMVALIRIGRSRSGSTPQK